MTTEYKPAPAPTIEWGTPEHPINVAICTPVLDKIDPYFFDSFLHMRKPGPSRVAEKMYGQSYPIMQIGQLIENARNMLTEQSLEIKDLTHIFWVDDDMVFEPDALERLIRHDLPIVGGLCFNRRHPYNPILRRYHDPAWGFPDKTSGWCYHYPPDTLFPVDATGGAFLLMKREVFDAMTSKYGRGNWWERLNGDAEDLSMCQRARDLGFPIYVDTGNKIGHRGDIVVTEAFANHNRQGDEWASWAPPAELTRAIGKPVASIIIPTYNQRPEYLKAAVLSALTQTLPVEVIVVDDGSTPPASEALGDRLAKRVKFVTHPENKGISAALNSGIHAASTEWIVWLSSDDIFTPDKVDKQLRSLNQSGSKAGYHAFNVIYTDGRFAPGTIPVFKNLTEQNDTLRLICAINGSTTMIHKSVFEDPKVGLYDENLKFGQDWMMWRRIGEAGYLFHALGEVLTTRREGENLTEQINTAGKDDTRRKRRDEEDELVRQWKPGAA